MRIRRPLLAGLVALAYAAITPVFAGGQTEVTVEFGGSRAGPPTDVDAEVGSFLVGGLRALRFGSNGSAIGLSILAGQSVGGVSGGDFVSGTLFGTRVTDFGAGWSAELDGKLFGFQVQSPFPYRAVAFEGGPAIRHRSSHTSFRIGTVLGAGQSRVELRRRPDSPIIRTVEDDLWRYGATADLLVGSASVMAGVSGGAHRTAGGDYINGGFRVVVGNRAVVAELRVDAWETPLGRETTGGLSVILPLSDGWGLRGFFGRSEPDPLTLAQPGQTGAGGLLGRRLYRSAGARTTTVALHEVVESTGTGAVVRLRMAGPPGALEVTLLGDFTLWEEVAMERSGGMWEVVLEIKAGTHHFGFLVDGEWYLPEDAQGVVPDEWGRGSATLVIER